MRAGFSRKVWRFQVGMALILMLLSMHCAKHDPVSPGGNNGAHGSPSLSWEETGRQIVGSTLTMYGIAKNTGNGPAYMVTLHADWENYDGNTGRVYESGTQHRSLSPSTLEAHTQVNTSISISILNSPYNSYRTRVKRVYLTCE